MRLTTGRTKIKQSYQTLAAHWEAAGDQWDDAARRDFDEKHIAPIEPQVASLLRAIDRLTVVLIQMQNECG